MKSIDVNDPRLTAFALGELDPLEAAEVIALVESDPTLQDAVDEVRRAAKLVSLALATEPSMSLTPEQHRTIEQRPASAVTSGNRSLVFRTRLIGLGAGLAAAAALVFAIVLTFNQGHKDDVAKASVSQPAGKQDPSLARDQGPIPPGSPAKSKSETGERHMDELAAALAMEDALAGGTDEESASWLKKDVPAAASREVPPPPSEVSTAVPLPQTAEPAPAVAPASDAAIRAHSADRGQLRDRKEATIGGSVSVHSRKAPTTTATLEEAESVTGGAMDALADKQPSGEMYKNIADNSFVVPQGQAAVSTMSIDVDTASYSNVRRILKSGKLPEAGAVRIEEMLNYFAYPSYEPPSGEIPFSTNIEVNQAPWNPEHRLVRIGLKAQEVQMDMRPPTSLVFLLDVSGSMNQPNKLPLVKESMKLLLSQLNGDDRLAIVTYAGSTGVLLDSTFCTEQKKDEIRELIDGLNPGGSTNGSSGIALAYQTAVASFIKGGVNRVILCTDGDFNVGISDDAELVRFIEEKRELGVFLSVLGFGEGNLKEAKMEQLADHGNGAFAYIDGVAEARKVLADQAGATLVTVAKDVKLQVEFNPAKVGSYRLIGYENRVLAAADFNDDRKDAGEIGAGHTVTALYEVAPPGPEAAALAAAGAPPVDDLKYQKPAGQPAEPSEDLLTLKIRYKLPSADESVLVDFPVVDKGATLDAASADFRFAAAVASFGMILRDSPHRGDATLQSTLDLARSGIAEPAMRLDLLAVADQFVEGFRANKAELTEQSARRLLESDASDAELAVTFQHLAFQAPRPSGLGAPEYRRSQTKNGEMTGSIGSLLSRIRNGQKIMAEFGESGRQRALRLEFLDMVDRAKSFENRGLQFNKLPDSDSDR